MKLKDLKLVTNLNISFCLFTIGILGAILPDFYKTIEIDTSSGKALNFWIIAKTHWMWTIPAAAISIYLIDLSLKKCSDRTALFTYAGVMIMINGTWMAFIFFAISPFLYLGP